MLKRTNNHPNFYFSCLNEFIYAFVCFFKGVFGVKYTRLDCEISGTTGYPAIPYFKSLTAAQAQT